MVRLSTDVGIPTSLQEMGIKEEDFEYMVQDLYLDFQINIT